MQTSQAGIAFLELEEGVVLKAYRDPVGILTIGAGLTKASGVIDPKPGMTLTKAEASALLAKALNRNYEPSVNRTMPGASQQEFDAGVSFHFNTGAIGRASWVRYWIERNWPQVEKRLKAWNKASGRVLPGLVKRRAREFVMLRDGIYPASIAIHSGPGLARVVVPIDQDEMAEARAAFQQLGYSPGDDRRGIYEDAVREFQRDHDLTVDGIIGRATLSTLQRRIDAKSNTKTISTQVAVGGSGVGGGVAVDVFSASEALLLGGGIAAVALFAAGWYAWRYRDVVAVKVQDRFPQIAAKLRSL